MNSLQLKKLAPLSGVAAIALMIYGIVQTQPFDYFPTADRAVEIFTEDPGRLQRGTIIAGFYSVVFMIWFVGSVYSALRKHEDEGGRLSAITFAGGVICTLGIAVGYGIRWVAAARAVRPGGISPEEAVIMNDLSTVMLANIMTIGLVGFIGGTGISSLCYGVFPAWFGWICVVFGAGLLTPIHWLFEGLAGIWIVVVSIWLFLRRTRAT